MHVHVLILDPAPKLLKRAGQLIDTLLSPAGRKADVWKAFTVSMRVLVVAFSAN
jgi:hypothetical protein